MSSGPQQQPICSHLQPHRHPTVAAAHQRQLQPTPPTRPGATQVVVASTNGVKVRAATAALNRSFPDTHSFDVGGAHAPSGVADQPMSDAETLQGARNRAQHCCSSTSGDGSAAGLVVAIEGGVARRPESSDYECFAWVVVRSVSTGAESSARSASFVLPPALSREVERGAELGAADDKLFGRTASGKGGGTIGLLTHGQITRELYYEHAVAMALIPFQNPSLYGEQYAM